jgi:2-amino-4-hydroxy-6-hydroxymethyldihydropteridine diphosphokinase
MLRLANRIETEAGRHPMRRRGARPLDIDIVAAKGVRLGWPRRGGPRPLLVLPHPLAHTRTFVLRPAVDVAPDWHHAGLGLTFARLYLSLRRRRGALERIDGPDWAARVL